MPRRNIALILCAVLVAVVCYQTADRNPLGRSFSEVADQIEKRYVDQVDRKALWSGAVRGMLGELKDPYSEYIEPKEAAEFEELLDQKFGGIGINVAFDPQSGRLTIISPIVGSPAYRAGILAGDVIAKIDGHATADMTYADATGHIRGKPGDEVRLTIERSGEEKPIDLPPIRREVINVDSVLGDTRSADDHWNFVLQNNPKIGYIRIASFGERTDGELKEALEQLVSQKVQGLVLDLRNDPGGLLPAAIGVCNYFLPEGTPIVSTKGRDGQMQQQYVADGGWTFPNIPLVVLINHGSASASEIVSACLQDSGRATVGGQRSYGKGTVQNMIPLRSGQGLLKLTTADYWRPSNHNIQRRPSSKETDEWGVTPDAGLQVKLSDEDLQKWLLWRRDRDVVHPHKASSEASSKSDTDDWSQHDSALHKAVEYLESRIDSHRE